MSGRSGRPRYPRPRSGTESVDVNACLRARLREYNTRDAEAVTRHIRGLRDAMEQDVDEVIRPLFGGSISKNTYVDGLSDVDVLMVVNDSSLSGQAPRVAIEKAADLIRRRMPTLDVTTGDLAVTIRYTDGNVIQILPAIRTKSGVRIANPKQNSWSQILHPERFAEKLTQVNQSNSRQVVPTIKLVKALVNRFAQSNTARPTGYHIESLAIEAFSNYSGPYDLSSMIKRFTSYAARAVHQPIKDSTGQSRYVDEYLGPQNSPLRDRASKTFKRIQEALDNCETERDVNDLFDT